MDTYQISGKTQATLDKAFMSHPLSQEQNQRLEKVHERLGQAARFLCTLTPDSDEQRKMIECLQAAGFWAREAISKNEVGK